MTQINFKLPFSIIFFVIITFAQEQKSLDAKFDCLVSAKQKGTENVFVFMKEKGCLKFSKDTLYIYYSSTNINSLKKITPAYLKNVVKSGEIKMTYPLYPDCTMKLLINKVIEIDNTPPEYIFHIQTPEYAQILKTFGEWKKRYDIQGKK